MKEIFSIDPELGITEYFEYDEMTGKATIETVQNVKPLIDRNTELANIGAKDTGIKKGLWHYASIPAVVVMELRKKGIDVYNPNDTKRVYQEINANYPYLKVTSKHHA